MKHMSAVGRVLRTKGVVLIRFHNVQPGLVFVHRVQDDLGVEMHCYIICLSQIIKRESHFLWILIIHDIDCEVWGYR